MHHLVGVAEIAEMLGVSRQRVNRIVQTDADFPAPEAELSAGRIWQRSQVEAWAKRHRRWPTPISISETSSEDRRTER